MCICTNNSHFDQVHASNGVKIIHFVNKHLIINQLDQKLWYKVHMEDKMARAILQFFNLVIKISKVFEQKFAENRL